MISKEKAILLFVGSILFLIFIAVIMSFFSDSGSLGGFSFFAPKVAVVKLEGEISNISDSLFSSNKTSFDVIDELEQAKDDPGVNAILLEINSPGGSAVASKQIFDKVMDIEKPVVVWISDVGASGGYYVASGADLIVAEEDSITGSIGVISILPNYEGLMEKLGVEYRVFKSGELKDLGSPFRDFTQDENVLFNEVLIQIHENFKKNVLKGRQGKISKTTLDSIADGRILTGLQAKNVGLIDETGNREYALLRASQLSGFDEAPTLVSYEDTSFNFLDIFAKAGFYIGLGFKQSLNYNPVKINT